MTILVGDGSSGKEKAPFAKTVSEENSPRYQAPSKAAAAPRKKVIVARRGSSPAPGLERKMNQTSNPLKRAMPCSGEMESAAPTQRIAVPATKKGFVPRSKSHAMRTTKKAEPMVRVGV